MEQYELDNHEAERNQEQIPTYLQFSINLEPFIQIETDNDLEFY